VVHPISVVRVVLEVPGEYGIHGECLMDQWPKVGCGYGRKYLRKAAGNGKILQGSLKKCKLYIFKIFNGILENTQ